MVSRIGRFFTRKRRSYRHPQRRYIKIIADVPDPNQQTINALVVAAHQHKKLAIAHAASSVAFSMALEGQVDMITHVPLDKTLDQATVARMVKEGRIAIPTLTMMEAITEKLKVPDMDYAHAHASVTAMYQSRIPILAGTDANVSPGAPAQISHGGSLHHELELLCGSWFVNC
jgi:imidazolonepropionase-like amidohydrolase